MSVEANHTTPIDIASAIIREHLAETDLERDRRRPPCLAVRQRIADQQYQRVYDSGSKLKHMAVPTDAEVEREVASQWGWLWFGLACAAAGSLFGWMVTL